jgi:hypothetical protein
MDFFQKKNVVFLRNAQKNKIFSGRFGANQMAPAKSSGHENPKPGSFGHRRECLGKKVEAKEANRKPGLS